MSLHMSKCHIVGNHMSRLIWASSQYIGTFMHMCMLPCNYQLSKRVVLEIKFGDIAVM